MNYCAAKVDLFSSILTDYQTSKIVALQHSNSMDEIDIITQSNINLYQISSNILYLNLSTVRPTVGYTIPHWMGNFDFLKNDILNIECSDPMESDIITINVVDIIKSEFCVATEDASKLYDAISHKIMNNKKVVVSFKGVEFLTPMFLNIAIFQSYGQFEEDIINDHLIIVDMEKDDKEMLSILEEKAKRYFKNPSLYDELHKASFGEDYE